MPRGDLRSEAGIAHEAARSGAFLQAIQRGEVRHVLSCIWSFEVSSDDTIVPVVEN